MPLSDADFFDLIQHKDVAGAPAALAEQPAMLAPLHFAARAGCADVARVLLASGADRSARDAAYHATPAGWAEFAGHAEIAALLSG